MNVWYAFQSNWLSVVLNNFNTILLTLREGLLSSVYPPSFCFGINSCCVIVLTTVEVQILLLEMECPSSCFFLSFLVDNKESYCWVPFSADYQMRENRSLRLSRGEEAGLPFPLLTNGYTCFPHQNVSERVFPHCQLAVGIWDECLILFPVKLTHALG